MFQGDNYNFSRKIQQYVERCKEFILLWIMMKNETRRIENR